MCLIVFAYKLHNKFKLIVAANRDEVYQRPTLDAYKWETDPFIIAGQDLEQGGTWLGINQNGLFTAVTNFMQPTLLKEKKLSRGLMLRDFLEGNQSAESYLNKFIEKSDLYNGFNFLIGDRDNLFYYSNIEFMIKKLEAGIYAVSNALLDTPWPKVEFAKTKLAEIISSDDISEAEIFRLLGNNTRFPDEILPKTGLKLEMERNLSPLFIKSDFYGTRSSNFITIDYADNVSFIERVYEKDSGGFHDNRFTFKIAL